MSIIDTIKKDPELSEMYDTMNWAFMVDTLTPAQIVYLTENPDKYEQWAHKCARRITAELTRRINKQTRDALSLCGQQWGIIVGRPPENDKIFKIPAADTNIHIPYNYKGVAICANQNT